MIYTVEVEIKVEAESEDEATEIVMYSNLQSVRGIIDYGITCTPYES